MDGKKILLAEEDEILADKLCPMLADAGYEVDLAEEGRKGRQLFDKYRYDLALIDYHLPDMSGCDLCQYVRNKDQYFPLIMLSFGACDHKFESFGAGVDDYILLNGDFRELLMRIKALTRRCCRTVIDQRSITAGDILIDLYRKEVKRGDKLIPLSASEFLLLQYLIRNKNRIVSRDELVCSIWGGKFYEKEARIASFINSLRKKIEDDSFPKCIYTVTGKGYLLAERPR